MRKILEYHTRRTPKCKYCDKLVKHNIKDGRNKGYCATCGDEACLRKNYNLPKVLAKKVYSRKHTCQKCQNEYEAGSRTQRWCKTCSPSHSSSAILQRYNISFPEYQTIIKKNDGKCPICLKNKARYVDHDHMTGRVRGIICSHCNMALNLVENVAILERALSYLKGKITNI